MATSLRDSLRPLAMLASLLSCLGLSLLRVAADALRLSVEALMGRRSQADRDAACDFYEGVMRPYRLKRSSHAAPPVSQRFSTTRPFLAHGCILLAG